VLAELNRQYPRPMRLEDPALGERRVSGVLMLEDQPAVARRVALLADATPLVSPGVIVLRGARAKP
jgi:transmembrane sensor